MKLTNAQRKIDARLRKNPLVQAAAIAHLAVDVEYTGDEDDQDEFNERAGEALARCCSLMGLPSSNDAVTEAILELSTKMRAALIKARLLSRDCAEAWQSQRKAAQSRKAA
jgi:hypothetical protein